MRDITKPVKRSIPRASQRSMHTGRIINSTESSAARRVVNVPSVQTPKHSPVHASHHHSTKPAVHHEVSKPRPEVPTLTTDQKVNAMVQALEKARRDLEREHRKKNFFKRFAVLSFAGLLLLSTGYVGFDTWMTNMHLKAMAGASAAPAETSDNTPVSTGTTFTGDADVTPHPANVVQAYTVDPDKPRFLKISKLGVTSRILPVGVDDNKTLQAPKNIFDAGWYASSAKPGENGAMLIDGHASENNSSYGLFGRLHTLGQGDEITIEKGDGTILKYTVAATETVPLESVDMKKLRYPYDGAQQGLNIITCTGEWTADKSTLDHRLIVYATLAS